MAQACRPHARPTSNRCPGSGYAGWHLSIVATFESAVSIPLPAPEAGPRSSNHQAPMRPEGVGRLVNLADRGDPPFGGRLLPRLASTDSDSS